MVQITDFRDRVRISSRYRVGSEGIRKIISLIRLHQLRRIGYLVWLRERILTGPIKKRMSVRIRISSV